MAVMSVDCGTYTSYKTDFLALITANKAFTLKVLQDVAGIGLTDAKQLLSGLTDNKATAKQALRDAIQAALNAGLSGDDVTQARILVVGW